jgi:hypothetical protein
MVGQVVRHGRTTGSDMVGQGVGRGRTRSDMVGQEGRHGRIRVRTW